MTADASSLALPLGRGRLFSRREWIESPAFDLAFFLLPGLATLPLVILALGVDRHFSVLFLMFAFPHYASTLSFYVWDDNKPRIRAQWVAFFIGPVLIAAAMFGLIYLDLAKVMQAALLAWNTFHVARQSCGILSIYRHRAGLTDVRQKGAVNFAIIATNVWMAFWNVGSNRAFDPLARITPDYLLLLRIGLGAVAAVSLVRLGFFLRERIKNQQAPTLPEWILLITSITFFHPYLWLADNAEATAVMLLPHYFQYLGIVWLLHRRKFRSMASEGSPAQRALGVLSRSTSLLLGCLASFGAAVIVLKLGLRHAGHDIVFEAFFILTGFEHYYLDGLFWAFRDPTVRKTMGPFLTGYFPQAAGAEA